MPPEVRDRLERFASAVIEENERQNLVARSTVDEMWERHILDSLQLLDLGQSGTWLDIGAGPGLPGLVLAIAGAEHVTLVEPRRRRVEFLEAQVAALDLADRATVIHGRVETLIWAKFANITARAVADLPTLFAMAAHLADRSTRWILPKGRSAAAELAKAEAAWQGRFRLVPSRTDEEAAIIVAEQVRARR